MSSAAATGMKAKKRDYWWTVFAVDPIAVPLAQRFADRRLMTADQATMVSVLLAVPIGFAYSSGSRVGLIGGAVLFYLAFLFDCVDGKMARALGTASPRGEMLDELADAVRRVSASLGLAVYLWRFGTGGSFWLAVAYVVIAFFFAAISGETRGEPQTTLGGRWSQALARRRLHPTPGTPDIGAIAFIFGPVTGFVVPALAVGVAMLTAGTLLVLRRRLGPNA
ncbi:MAG: CDP-alcohol phosphatidyltransferase family protein [Actinomycetota bacterium]|nr:CDP-alcohol phosphatidyltransferase family protein [Actinomycetota bacterium]